jgi:hypothetical protein
MTLVQFLVCLDQYFPKIFFRHTVDVFEAVFCFDTFAPRKHLFHRWYTDFVVPTYGTCDRYSYTHVLKNFTTLFLNFCNFHCNFVDFFDSIPLTPSARASACRAAACSGPRARWRRQRSWARGARCPASPDAGRRGSQTCARGRRRRTGPSRSLTTGARVRASDNGDPIYGMNRR